MDRYELECFLVLAEELHFGRTATRLHLSRARVSQLVQKLERRVGAPLFARTSRQVTLTRLGERLRDDLGPHHRAIREALERATATARGMAGALHVGFSTPLAGEMTMRAAEALRTAHPDLVVEICEVPMSDPFGLLRRGQFDVQLVDFPVRESDLTAGPALLTEERVLAVAAGHPLSARHAVSLEDLGDVPLLTVDGDVPDYWLEHRFPSRTPNGRPIDHRPAVTNMQEALVLVSAGKGAMLTAAHTAAYHRWPGVAYVPLVGGVPVRYGLVWRTGNGSPAVELFGHLAGKAARAVVGEDPQRALPR
ncbi:LysR family transcriptional regulator [Wenjunlia vitaminophila]|uniref:LysR family transcriptional regulator n=1 Tax=Wenjunlia vitaminophila TaxID=76728 RepID=A0A0T6LMZ6_WENVI|nr:LysR substrate-binding domain-containing protein [Wenjunlia vitaminophila]KRV47279.1 LysR family transcriptional regulator [Wenjunlia vitaminophila]